MKINIEIDTRNSEDKGFLSSLKDTVLEFLDYLKDYTDDDEDEDDEGDEDEESAPDRCVFFDGPTAPPIESSSTALWWAMEGDDALVLVSTGAGWAAITDVSSSQYGFLTTPANVLLDCWVNPRSYTVQSSISVEDAVAKYGDAVTDFVHSPAKLVQITVGYDVDDDDDDE